MNNFDETYQKCLTKIMNIIETAKATGKPQLVDKWVSGGFFDEKLITSNVVTVLAMPDGTLTTYDSNDENVSIPEYEGE